MKKLIAILLSVTCLLGVLPVFSTASEDTANLDFALYSSVSQYYFYAELNDGFFAEGQAPGADVIVSFLALDVDMLFENYIVSGEDDYFITYNIPAEEYEALVFTYFTQSEAITNMLRASSYYNADGGYYEIVTGDGYGDMIPDCVYYGHEKKEDGSYVAYATLLESYVWSEEAADYVAYAPGEGDIEGIDYIYMPSTWLANEDDWAADSLENVGINHGNIPVRLVGYIQSVMAYNEETAIATITSFEKVEGEGFPASESIIIYEETEEEKFFIDVLSALLFGSYVSFDEESFDKRTVVTSTNVTEGESYNNALAALESSADDLIVFEITAALDGQAVQPNAPVKVIFSIPVSFTGELALFYVADDGTVEEIECTVDYDYGIVTAYLSHFSTYVLADVSSYVPGDVNGDGVVSASDMTRLMKYLAGEEVFTQVTNVNGDEITDTKDLTRLMKYIAGEEVDIF